MRRALLVACAVVLLLPAAAQARAVPARRSFTRALECGSAGSARVNGRLTASIEPRLRARWNGTRIRSARAVATLRGSAELGVQAEAGASCSLPVVPVSSWNAPAIRFQAGPVPIVVVPRVTLYVSAEARASVSASTRVHGTLTAVAGLRYDGRAHRIGRLRERLRADPPRAGSAASLSARVTPSLELLLYGQAGPRFDFGTGLQLDSGPPQRMSAPLEFSAGLRLPGLDVGPYTVLSRSIPLGAGRRTVAAPAEPAERVRIDWDTPADVDLHVWDENGRHTWFRESGIPGVLLSRDDTDGYGPETLDVDERTGQLTYGVCLFDARGAVATRVTAKIGGPGTGGRTTAASLREEGDGAVFDGPFEPPPGWCDGRHQQ